LKGQLAAGGDFDDVGGFPVRIEWVHHGIEAGTDAVDSTGGAEGD